ncbi:DinB family protein [Pinibacter soli]|uniref:DinB family protein n=1 Tax=Pinibacter soli TaxID=3044211 RepID=A0ABT6R6X9_9BACT|nr:DinB family protein [Pinibacter soli]MDI3318312.1 DinB family protein [Pinibacter soli]
MDKRVEKIKGFRTFLLQQIEELTIDQLNKIPDGFNNNIVWNIAHMICTEQIVCYVRSNLPVIVEDKYFSPYLPGTKPTSFVDVDDVAIIKQFFTGTSDQLNADLDHKSFANYSPSVAIPKTYGFEVNNIDDALEYLLYHEGLHSGYVMSLKRMVTA